MDKQETINKLKLCIAMIDYVNAELDRLFIAHMEATKMRPTDTGPGKQVRIRGSPIKKYNLTNVVKHCKIYFRNWRNQHEQKERNANSLESSCER